MRKCLSALLFLLFLFCCAAAACAEITVTADPAAAAVGDEVRITVTAPEGAARVFYTLSTPERKIFSTGKKGDTHFVTAFRPRAEADYTLSVTVQFEDKHKENAEIQVPVSGANPSPVPMGPDVIYSQKDGWWNNKSYTRKNTLENAGCALFTLSHALQRMGWDGSELNPEVMGKTYAGCLGNEGTRNEQLITMAAQTYRFTTQEELLESPPDIADCLRAGDLFSFSIVNGHIALVSGISEDGTKVRIVDSAPTATFERIKNGSVYYTDSKGVFVEAKAQEDMPGFIWYFENAGCNGMEYWMDLDYVARRGVRLIRPPWLYRNTESGRTAVTLQFPGASLSAILQDGEKLTVPTSELSWAFSGSDSPSVAVVSKKKNVALKDANGKKTGTLPPCAIVLVMKQLENSALIRTSDRSGYVSLSDVELVPVSQAAPRPALVSLKGNTSGRASVKLRYGPSAKEKVVGEWKTGTRVAILKEKDGFCQVEAGGIRAWIQQEYLTPEE